MTEFKIPEPHFSLEEANLRQAVEWIAFGSKPLPSKYEITLRGIEEIQNSSRKEVDHAKRILVFALLEGRLTATAQKSDEPIEDYLKPYLHKLHRLEWNFDKIQWDKSAMHVYEDKVYINIFLNTDELFKAFPIPLLKSKSDPTIHARPSYLSPYMQLLDLAVTEFKISPTNQPSTKILIDWFLDKLKTVQGEQYASESKAKMLATFVREPESQIGGLKKLKKNNPK